MLGDADQGVVRNERAASWRGVEQHSVSKVHDLARPVGPFPDLPTAPEKSSQFRASCITSEPICLMLVIDDTALHTGIDLS